TRQGFPEDKGHALLDDGRGSYWMSSDRGLYRVSKKDLAALADRTAPGVPFETFGRTDGLQGQPAGTYPPCAFRGRNGRLYFATTRGVACVDPERILRNAIVPEVHVERLAADGEEMRPGARLRAGSERVAIRFTATSVLVPERVRFKYRLDGF